MINPALAIHWEYPYHDARVRYSSFNNLLDITINYYVDDCYYVDDGSLGLSQPFKQINYPFYMNDWFFSFEKEPDGKTVIITLSINKDEPTIYDQQFAIKYQGAATDEWLEAVLAGSKK